MNRPAIQHTANSFYRYLLTPNSLVFRLRVGRREAASVTLIYWPRANPGAVSEQAMAVILRDGSFDYYETSVEFQCAAKYTKYYFRVKGRDGETCCVSEYGCTDEIPRTGFFEHLYTNKGEILCKPRWAKGLIYYQIFPDRFAREGGETPERRLSPWGSTPNREDYTGGNLAGIIKHLDYIESLGAECLYLTPVFLADYNHKYAATDYFQVDPDFGDEGQLKDLVRQCHGRNIKIILDGVFNHCGVHFAPFEDLLTKQEASEYKDWFYIKKFPVEISADCYECVGDFKWMPKLNTSNPEVRSFILKVMSHWVDSAGIDGWRLDVADEVDVNLWRLARMELKQKHPNILLLGETWGDASRLLDGSALDAVMSYQFRDAVLDFAAKKEINAEKLDGRLNSILAKYHASTDHFLYNLLDSHDTPRFLRECDGDTKKLKLAAALQMMFPGSPAILYGDEVGLTGANDPDCRRCMVWDKEQNADLLAWYKKLILIRKSRPAVREGKFCANLCEGDVYGFIRWIEGKSFVYTVLNAGERRNVSLPVTENRRYTDLISGITGEAQPMNQNNSFYNIDLLTYTGVLNLEIPECGVMIFEPAPAAEAGL
jgi:glycosidase